MLRIALLAALALALLAPQAPVRAEPPCPQTRQDATPDEPAALPAGEQADGESSQEATQETPTKAQPEAQPEAQARGEDPGQACPESAADTDPQESVEPGEPESVIDILEEDSDLEATAQEEGEEEAPSVSGQAAPAADGEDSGLSPEAAALQQSLEAESGALEEAAADAAGLKPGLFPPVSDKDAFPTAPVIEEQKQFWIKIFTRYTDHEGLIHDGRIAMPIYEALDLSGMKYRAQRRYIKNRKRQIVSALNEIAAAVEKGAEPAEEHRWLLEKLPREITPEEIREHSRNVRFQRGLANRFKEGLERSGAYLDRMREIMREHGVPEDLVYLPHVESSFDLRTTSKFGAAGVWQFTRGTGRIFMTINYEIDERRDPLIATRAAARFLRQNYDKLGNWPLAITAYNHGPRSMLRAQEQLGTSDMEQIIKRYKGRSFKFASKNFYAEFLAAREVARNPQNYFLDIEFHQPLRFSQVTLPHYMDIGDLSEAMGVSRSEIRRLNPSLRRIVWSGSKYIPKGFNLRMPDGQDPAGFLAAIPEDRRYDKQKLATVVRVTSGDSLYSIGRQLGVSWVAIADANNLSGRRHIYPGQKLIIPYEGQKPPPAVLAASLSSQNAGPETRSTIVKMSPEEAQEILTSLNSAGQDGNILSNATRFQELGVLDYESGLKEGSIMAAYGETLGAYSRWAGVTVGEIRRLNGMSSRSKLRPGRTYRMPLDTVSRDQFIAQRLRFHQQRMDNFMAEYDITDVVKIKVRRGESSWDIAQNNNVPMWLFYRENPLLLEKPLQPGMQVTLPVVKAISRAEAASIP